MKNNYITILLLLLTCITFSCTKSAGKDYRTERAQMISKIEKSIYQTSDMVGRERFKPEVMKAMGMVPRDEFCIDSYKDWAYENRPLPIGHGQTISQPYIVALMTELIDPEPHHTILEVGTGSGYQAAILSRIVKQVYSIEIIPALAARAKKTLKELHYDNVDVAVGDGYYGDVDHAPYDSIIVTAAAGSISPHLIKQLRPMGKMIIPVGVPFQVQHLILVEKDKKGIVTTRSVLPVAFVPLTGNH